MNASHLSIIAPDNDRTRIQLVAHTGPATYKVVREWTSTDDHTASHLATKAIANMLRSAPYWLTKNIVDDLTAENQ